MLTEDLAKVLADVHRPGDFFTSGTLTQSPPRIDVSPVGTVALPLLPAQAQALIAAADRAPYGKGADTIVDPTVRDTWQIAADRVTLGGRHWPGTLAQIVAAAAEGLGVSGDVEAELYKLLIYAPGGFFVPHRDTEKAPGMFATLVIVLPSLATGGALVVRHQGREARLDAWSDDPAEVSFAAFYADCPHEVLPVTDGYRLTLIYNLVRLGRSKPLEPPSFQAEEALVRGLLRAWAVEPTPAEEDEETDPPAKLAYPLSHAYTPAELSFAALKGVDAAVARVLTAAAAAAGCSLHLALLTIEEAGSAEHNGEYRPRRWGRHRDDDEEEDQDGADFEVVEVTYDDWSLSDWRTPADIPASLGKIPLLGHEICPPDAVDEMEPDEQHFQEATGNEGASFERTYRRAALVLWPAEQLFTVVAQAGRSATLPLLDALVDRWTTSGDDGDRNQARVLTHKVIARWGKRDSDQHKDGETSASQMARSLIRLAEPALTRSFLETVVAAGRSAKADNPAVAALLRLLPADAQAEMLTFIVTALAERRFATAANLLWCLATDIDPAVARPAATVLARGLPGDRAPPPEADWRNPAETISDTFVFDTLSALAAIDPGLAQSAAALFVARPAVYGADLVLIPAMRRFPKDAVPSPVASVRDACIAHLQSRVAEPLAPPADFVRPNPMTCNCEHCRQVGAFLGRPDARQFELRAAAPIRSHVESEIANRKPDLTTATVRQGSPHRLVCTKTDASYQRRVVQRKQDLDDLKHMGA